ncbi:selenoprotein S [Mytilus galloprovincialis]|uniref:Selenoprotein S n=1 Tax=Mytilus galloprovincialis TaxID=29158 RepID=A0A8B6DUZ4_MYTGA|nr:selenoprotein S [Mytilus galloprovincialis]
MGDAPQGNQEQGQEVPVNQNPQFVTETFSFVIEFLQQYGWFVLFGFVVLIYIKVKLDPHIRRVKKKAEDVIEQKKFDPDVAQRRMEQMERSRQRLQEQHDAEAARYAEKQRIKEEEKRKLKIEDWENHQQGKGYRSKVKPKEEQDINKPLKAKPRLRTNDYNPLMGDMGGASYRPPRRSGGGG